MEEKIDLRQIEKRESEIQKLVQGDLTLEQLNELENEVKELQEQRKAFNEMKEKRQALIDATQRGEGVVVEEKKEERKMDVKKFDIETVEYRNLWAKALQGNLPEEEYRAYAASDTHNAVPVLVANQFFEKMVKLAPMLSEITLMQVAGNLKFLAEGTRNSAAIHTENTAVTPAADTVLSVQLGGFEFMKVIRISASAMKMSPVDFVNWLVEMLSGDIACALDNYIINDSSKGIVAITYSTGTNQILQTATTGYGYDDILKLEALLPAAYDGEAKYLVSKAVLFQKIKSIVGTDGHPIFDPVAKTILGRDVIIDDYVGTAKNALYLGRWKDIVGNLSQPVVVERSNESGFLNNSVDFRGVAIFDSAPAKKDAIVRLVTTTS